MIARRFYVWLVMLLLAAVGIHVLLSQVLRNYPIDSLVWRMNLLSLSFIALKSAGAYWLVQRNLSLSAWKFVNIVSGVMLLKLLLSIGWVLIMVFGADVPPFAFALPYFGAYILFTSFEIIALLNNLRPDSQKPSV
ncbi:MAG: hypothetical protein KF690_01960 [Bacteroidetes bacterium]|nr:hypothetical protein [Bacteroidota bacterium]